MSRVFLTAGWRNLLMANYIIDPRLLRPHLPCYTELDDFEGSHYVSLVGFLFEDTRISGISFPFHRNFEEVNLRFYVRYKEEGKWKRGVVFLKEIVPRFMISLIANRLYGENYATHPMKHQWEVEQDQRIVEYYWKVKQDWNFLKARAENKPQEIGEGSIEEFITEHYWGYTYVNDLCSGVYQVRHPKWRIYPVIDSEIKCSTEILYGAEFAEALSHPPHSVFLAEGSVIEVLKGSRIFS